MSISAEDNNPPARRIPSALREALDPGEDRLLARILIDKAKGGDAVAVRFVAGHLYPRPRARPIVLALPEGTHPGNVVAVFDATLRAMAAGEITPEEARTVTRVLDGRLRVLEAWRRERQMMRHDNFAPDGKFRPDKPRFRMDWLDDEEVEEPPGFAAAWAKHEALLRAYEARWNAPAPASPAPTSRASVSPAPASPAAGPSTTASGDPSTDAREGRGEGSPPANHLHPQAAPQPAHGGAATDAGGGEVDDRLHSACIPP